MAMKRRAMMGTVAWVLLGVLALVGSSPAGGQVEPALAEIEVEVRPEILGPVLFPWRTVKESTVPIRTLNKTDIGAAAVEQEEDHETQADMADAGPAIVYADGLLSPNWGDLSWDARVDFEAPCPPAEHAEDVDPAVVSQLRAPKCLEADLQGSGGLSLGLRNGSRFNETALPNLVLWLYLAEEGAEPRPAGNATASTTVDEEDLGADSIGGAPSVDICDHLDETDNMTVVCPAVRILAGRIDPKPSEGPIKLFLHRGSSVFSVPLALANGEGSELKRGDWTKVSVPLGAQGWGGARRWNRLSLVSSKAAETRTGAGSKIYLGEIKLEPRRGTEILSSAKIEQNVTTIDEGQAERIERVGVQVGSHGEEISSAPRPSGESSRLVRKLYSSEEGGLAKGVSDWSWLHGEMNEGGEEDGVCAALQAFGGLSLKATPSFGKASSLRFAIKPPATRFFIAPGATIESVISLRLDATKERRAHNASEGAAPWQTFHSSELIPMTMAVPGLLAIGNSNSHQWLRGVLPLSGKHAWDRVSFINSSPQDGVVICVDNVTAEYIVEAVGANATSGEKIGNLEIRAIPSLAEELESAKNATQAAEWAATGTAELSDSATIVAFAETSPTSSQNDEGGGAPPLPIWFWIVMIIVGALTFAAVSTLAYLVVAKGKVKGAMARLDDFWKAASDAAAGGKGKGYEELDLEGGAQRVRFVEIECDFDFSKAIGLGATCAVFKGSWRGRDVAIKAIRWNGGSVKAAPGQSAILREMEIFSTIRSPHVIGYYGFAHANDTTYLLLELCDGNLQSCMKKGERIISMVQALKLLRQICTALQHLNDVKISHRDVKSSNVLLKQCGGSLIAKLGDLGVSKAYSTLQHSQLETFCGTPRWMAPEKLCLMGSGEDQAVGLTSLSPSAADVYGFGIVAWEVAFYSVNGYYQLPFDEFLGRSGSFGLLESGIYDSVYDGTYFNDPDDPTIIEEAAAAVASEGMATLEAEAEDTAGRFGSREQGEVEADSVRILSRVRFLAPSGDCGGGDGSSRNTFHDGSARRSNSAWDRAFEATLYSRIVNGARPTVPEDVPRSLRDLIEDCWCHDPMKRPSFATVAKRLEILIENSF